jgi:hypothetical protein
MPIDRFLHPRAGRSVKVSMLTDLEYRVWTQYLLSSDDFGVMRKSALAIQNGNDHLANRKQTQIQRCLETLTRIGLLQKFEHQGRWYLFQHDWQKWQKVEYPRATNEPQPPPESLALCDEATAELFGKHPGGKTQKLSKRSPNVSQMVPESPPNDLEKSATTRAGAPAERLTAKANANGLGERRAPLIDQREHRNHAQCGRVCLHASLFGEFVRRRNHDQADREIRDWALGVETDWSIGTHQHHEPGEPFAFWRARYDEQWPAAPKAIKGRWDDWAKKSQEAV